MKSARAVSAGGVVFRQHGGRTEIVLVGRTAHDIWGLPKGTPDNGETIEQTACREVAEETGIIPSLVDTLGAIEYYFVARNTRFHKTVHFFLMEATGGDVANHDHEYDVAQWFEMNEAISRLSYPNEIEVARRAREILLARTEAQDDRSHSDVG